MTTFHLIRHAERSGDQEMLVGRMEGFHLSTSGRAQAERLARKLGHEPITHVFSSPLERTRETAAPLARELGLVVEVSAAIGEINSGGWTGRTFRELNAADARWRQFNRLRSITPIPGGEAMVEVQARFVGEILRWREQYPEDALAVVSHADPIKVALATLLGAPLDFYDRLEIGLGSVSTVTVDDGGAKVQRVNYVPSPNGA